MTTVNEIMREIKAGPKGRSQWERGVRMYAIDLLEDVKDWKGGSFEMTRANADEVMLCGARDWLRFSEGAWSLIYSEDIAKRLCPPAEFKRFKARNFPDPNPREGWIQVQARALYQAARLIKEKI